MNKYTPLLTRCRIATQNANAAQLLYRIAFWMPKATIEHGGLKWSANSAAQWCQQTGLSFDQYRRAVTLLKTLELVETEQHLFGRKNVTHVRLTEKGSAVTGKPPLDQCTAASPGSGNSAHPGKCENAQLYIQGESSLESLQGESNTAFASAHANCLTSEQEVSGEDKNNSNPNSKKNPALENDEHLEEDPGSPQINSMDAGATNYTPAAIIASTESSAPTSANSISHPAPVLQPNKKQDPNPADLPARWKVLIIELYGDYVPPFTKKEFGQFKDFIKACPPGQALSMLDCCLRDWGYFTGYAKADYAAFGIPPRPTLDFLMKYRAAAINFALSKAKQAAIPVGVLTEPPKKITVALADEPTVEIPMEEPKMTLEEFQAIMNDGNSVTGTHAVKVGHAVEHKKNVGKKSNVGGLTYDEMMELVGEEFCANFEPLK